MKTGFYTAFISVASLLGFQASSVAYSTENSSYFSESSLETLQQQFTLALAKQDKQQITYLQKKITALLALPPELLENQIAVTEKILTRIFKTDKNLTPKFIDYLYFEPLETQDEILINEMKKNLLVSFLANENARIYIRRNTISEQFIQALKTRGAKDEQIVLLAQSPKAIFTQITAQMRQDFPAQTVFPITENRVSLITPSSQIKSRLALANAVFDRQFKGVEVDDFSYLDQPRENLQHNNETIRYKVFQAMLEGIN